jgi:hypothetical protein
VATCPSGELAVCSGAVLGEHRHRQRKPVRIASLGHVVFAATMVAVGVMGLATGTLTVVWLPVPAGAPARLALAYLCALISVATGVGLLWRGTAAPAARILLAFLLLWFLAFRLPGFFHALTVDVYWSACSTAVLISAAWVLYVWFAPEAGEGRVPFATGDRGLRVARIIYGAAMIPFGWAHFAYLARTAALVPRWLPGDVAWASFTGATFIAAGVAAIAGVYARLAVALSALQMGLFLLLVWVPTVAAGHISAFQWAETVTTWVLTAAAWVVADSYWMTSSPRHSAVRATS